MDVKQINKQIENFLVYCKVQRQMSNTTTIPDYKAILYHIDNFYGRNVDFTQLTYDDINNYLSSISNQTYNTYNKKLNVLKSLFSWLEETDQIDKNLMRKFKPRKQDVVKKKIIVDKVDDQRNIINACTNIRDRLLIITYLETGMRVSELCNLTLDNIDFTKKEIVVIGKGIKIRTIPILDNSYFELINNYIKTFRQDKIAQYNKTNENYPYLFIGLRGNKMNKDNINSMIKNVCHKAGIRNWKEMSNHKFRYTYGSNLVNNGADLKTVQSLLGHSNINTTASCYVIKQQEQLRKDINGKGFNIDNVMEDKKE